MRGTDMRGIRTIWAFIAAAGALLGLQAPMAHSQNMHDVPEKYSCPPNEQAEKSCRLSFAGEVQELCSAIDNQTMEGQPAWDVVVYTYQTHLFRLAGATPGESEESIYAKVRSFFAANRTRLSYNAMNFNPRNADILKLAIARKSAPFIEDVLVAWKLDLNFIDPVDSKTVLDYIIDRRAEAKLGSNLYNVLEGYFTRFRRAGALTAEEVRASH